MNKEQELDWDSMDGWTKEECKLEVIRLRSLIRKHKIDQFPSDEELYSNIMPKVSE